MKLLIYFHKINYPYKTPCVTSFKQFAIAGIFYHKIKKIFLKNTSKLIWLDVYNVTSILKGTSEVKIPNLHIYKTQVRPHM